MRPTQGGDIVFMVEETVRLYLRAAKCVRAGALDEAARSVSQAASLREQVSLGSTAVVPDQASELAGALREALVELQQALGEGRVRLKAEQTQVEKGLRQLGLLRNVLTPGGAQLLDTRR